MLWLMLILSYIRGECASTLVQAKSEVAITADYIVNDNVYTIKNTDGLRWFAEQVTNNNTFEGKIIQLEEGGNFDTTASDWESIGINSPGPQSYFAGTFDGKGQTVTIKGTESFFGYVKGGTVRNLTINGEIANAPGNHIPTVGIAIGRLDNGTISNVTTMGSIDALTYTVGGVLGTAINSTIENCTNTADVTGQTYGHGGIVGGCVDTNISNCINSGDVTCTNNGMGIGGIVGIAMSRNDNTSTISFCSNNGTINGGAGVGGIAGTTSGEFVTTVSIEPSQNEWEDYTGTSGGIIINSTNSGNITASQMAGGGIVGLTDNNQFQEGKIGTSIINCANFGKISSSQYIAGIAVVQAQEGQNATVELCINKGTVSDGTYYAASFVVYAGGPVSVCNNYYQEQNDTEGVLSTGDSNLTQENNQVIPTDDTWLDQLNTVVDTYNASHSSGPQACKWVFGEDGNPTFGIPAPSIEGDTPFESSTEITITVPEGATVYYTTDGNEPAKTSTLYTGPFYINGTTTVKAIVIMGEYISDVEEAVFKKIPTAPTITGTTPFEESTTVTITVQEGADIYYTTDGTTPSQTTGTKYEAPFTLTTSVMVKAVAILDGVSSLITEKEFKRIPVTITAEEDAAIYYTTDGSDPTSSSELYNEPLTFTETTTLKVIAVIDGVSSEVVTVVLTKNEPEPEEPEIPDTPVTPDYPDYYNIYVDECEGVTVETSTNVVREGNSMSFTIEVAEGYTAEDMVVKVKRSLFGYTDVIEPNEEGKYEIRNIYTEIYITVEGVEKETPTGIEELQSTKVYAQDGSLYVQTPKQEEVRIISISGAVIKNETQIGLKRYDLPRGIYIICIGEERVKVRN